MLDDRAARLAAGITVLGYGREGGKLDPRTRKKYARSWVEADEWARSMRPLNPSSMPWTSELLAEYAVWLLERGYAKSTVDGRLSAVRVKHRERGWPVPDGVAAWYVLRGEDDTARGGVKVNTPRPRRAALQQLARNLDPARPKDSRDLSLVTLGWDLHAGVREIVSLNLGDVKPDRDRDRMIVRIPARGEERWWPVEHDHDPVDVCPIEAVQAWLGHLYSAGVVDGPLYRPVDKGGNISGTRPIAGHASATDRLTERGVQRVWRRLAPAAGLDQWSRAGDLRWASAVDAARNGVPVRDVLRRGGWKENGPVLLKLMDAMEEEVDGDAVEDGAGQAPGEIAV